MKKAKMKGQSLVEYLVLIGVVVLGSIAGLSYFKNQITDSFNAIINGMTEK
ncbi:hypothetical protein KAU39_00065 [bacterium]|nr:hypothetical protein [bacterium]